jgi:hypothetical protein
MTLATLVTRAYLLATGKATAPASTTNKYSKLVGLANVCQNQWENEPDVEWDSLYLTVTLAATITATDTFALSASIREISHREGDYIRVVHTDLSETKYQLVKPNEMADYRASGIKVVSRVGSNLVFSSAFVSTDPEFGGSIKVPCYGFVSTLVNDSDVVQVDNPLWLAYMVAAEYCRTDVTLNYRTDDLVARANQVMEDMKQSQDSMITTPIRTWTPLARSW